jgi:hypothetical protein
MFLLAGDFVVVSELDSETARGILLTKRRRGKCCS